MYKTYLINYDPLSPRINPEQLIAFVRASAYTYQYYSPHLGAVFVKTTVDLIPFYESYGSFFLGEHLFIAEIDHKATAGFLPRVIWDWINSSLPPPLPSSPLSLPPNPTAV